MVQFPEGADFSGDAQLGDTWKDVEGPDVKRCKVFLCRGVLFVYVYNYDRNRNDLGQVVVLNSCELQELNEGVWIYKLGDDGFDVNISLAFEFFSQYAGWLHELLPWCNRKFHEVFKVSGMHHRANHRRAISFRTGWNHMKRLVLVRTIPCPKKGKSFEMEFSVSVKHENLMPVLHVFQEDDYYYLIHPYKKYRNISTLVEGQDRLLEEKKARKISRQVISFLAHLHRRNKSHCEIRMDNIFVDNATGSNLKTIVCFTGLSSLEDRLNTTAFKDLKDYGEILFELVTGHKTKLYGRYPRAGIIKDALYEHSDLSDSGMDFLVCCLQLETKYPASDLKEHTWLAENEFYDVDNREFHDPDFNGWMPMRA